MLDFKDMSREEKIAHVEWCCNHAVKTLQEVHGPVFLADIMDVWDYWIPWMLSELKAQEAEE